MQTESFKSSSNRTEDGTRTLRTLSFGTKEIPTNRERLGFQFNSAPLWLQPSHWQVSDPVAMPFPFLGAGKRGMQMNTPISFELLLREYQELTHMPLVALANEFGRKFHFGQFRKNKSPYMTHPYSVLRIAMMVGLSEPETLSAILVHDVLEENAHRMPEVLTEMVNILGDSVAQMVVTLTDDPGLSRQARFEQQLLKMASASPEVVAIKLCDRLAVLQEPGLCAARWQASACHARSLIQIAEQRPSCHNPLSIVQRRLTHHLSELISSPV